MHSMADTTRAQLDASLAAALAGGDPTAIHAAADAILAHVRTAKAAPWAGTGTLNRFTLLPADWAAVIASSDPAGFGRELWARHRASRWKTDELPLFEYLDALRCYIATGSPTSFPTLRDDGSIPNDIAEEVAALEVIADGLRRRNRGRASDGIAFFESRVAAGGMRAGSELYPAALRATLGTPRRRTA